MLRGLLVFFAFVFGILDALHGASPPLILEKERQWGIAEVTGKLLLTANNALVLPLGKNQFWVSTNVAETCSAALFDANLKTRLTDYVFSSKTGPTLITPPCFSEYGALDAYVECRGRLLPVLVFRDGSTMVRGEGVWESSGGQAVVPSRNHAGKIGLFDIKARKFIPNVVHDEISLPNNGLSIVRDGDKMGAINCLGQQVLPCVYDNIAIASFNSGAVSVLQNGRRGLVGTCGEWLLPLQADVTYVECNSGLPYVKIEKNGKIRLFDTKKRKFVSNRLFDEITAVSRCFFIVKLHDSWILMRDTGEEILKSKCKIDFCSDYRSPRPCIVRSDESEYYIVDGQTPTLIGDVNGIEALPYNAPSWLLCKRGRQKGVLSLDGKQTLIPFEECKRISNWGKAIRKITMDSTITLTSYIGGNLLCDKHITILDDLDSSGYARIVCDGKAGLVDGDCNFVLPCQYEDVGHFGEGLVPAKQGGKWGFVELSGKWAIPARFEEARSFKDGYAPVCVGGKWGFIGKSGKVATPFEYEDVKDVREGHFRAKVNGKWGIFALDGRCTLPAEYDAILAEGEYGYGDP